MHGVTTVVSGNCGVGFAPVRPGREQWLIELMEGVEDIPGTALAEGITWQWETFPEYLDAIDKRHLAVDSARRSRTGRSAATRWASAVHATKTATDDDIAAMARIVQEAIEAGALGFSTSRTEAHRAIDGEPVPGTFAAEDELFGLGRAMAAGGRAVFEVAPQGAAGEDLAAATMRELDWMTRLAAEIDRPVSFTMIQVDARPGSVARAARACRRRARRTVSALPRSSPPRPFGMLFGLPGSSRLHPPAHLPQAEGRMRPRGVGAAAGRSGGEGGDPGGGRPAARSDRAVRRDVRAGPALHCDRLYALGNPPDYEPTPDQTVAAIAARRGEDPLATLYDLMLESAPARC